ncbi:unnamed protein product [Nezara viridula]|uniref:Uncharacterized protein n=1 Tax=Nezara viridula TaxID=85310 RepID=A0A9P0HPX9_NEZVI|nr:unnamed protein product [Nezara viridula]
MLARLTYKFFPDVKRRIKNDWVEMDFWAVQLLTGRAKRGRWTPLEPPGNTNEGDLCSIAKRTAMTLDPTPPPSSHPPTDRPSPIALDSSNRRTSCDVGRLPPIGPLIMDEATAWGHRSSCSNFSSQPLSFSLSKS